MLVQNRQLFSVKVLRPAFLILLMAMLAGACGPGADEGDVVDNEIIVPADTDASTDPQVEVFIPPTGGAMGEACTSDDQCTDKLCVPSQDGTVCAGPCDEACAAMGWVCRMTKATPPTLLCVPPHPALCTPCIANADCSASGIKSEVLCLDMGEEGRFCGGDCSDDVACPEGYACTEGSDIDGNTASQCWPTSGVCSCSPDAITAEASTVCHTSNPIGTCLGNRACGPEGLSACSALEASVEVCDGVDNDCDGAPDEDLAGLPCDPGPESPCGGTTTCDEGISGCDPKPSMTEVCDFIDNDCDDQIDEDFPGLKQPCDGPDEDNCKNGILTCSADGLGTECAKESGGPQVEVCDGKDNNCNDQVDEGVKNACGDCGEVPKEICDGKDTDCDGTPDNTPGGCTCVSGETQACGKDVGECATGVQVCVDGEWSTCNDKGPQPEACDGKDNNCDGTPDNPSAGCACTNGQTKNCGSNVGECNFGVQVCVNGQWTACNDKGPQAETCDGKDNDCNGTPDDGCDCVTGALQSCGTNTGEGSTGTETRINGSWAACNAKGPQAETCDGKDNDCNGTPDDGCDCVTGALQTCGTNTGECSTGTETCINGSWTACNAKGPSAELCDGKDNDCNGTPDEGCDCITGQTKSCGTNTGECSTGTETCINGSWSNCTAKGPQAETCDGKDNNCNGTPDEGFVGNPCASSNQYGTCNGTTICFGPNGMTCNAPQPKEEVCDGYDNDCDKLTDEDNVCAPPKACSINLNLKCTGSQMMQYTIQVKDAVSGHIYWTEMPNGIAGKESHNFCTTAIITKTIKQKYACVKAHYEVTTCQPSGTAANNCSAQDCKTCP